MAGQHAFRSRKVFISESPHSSNGSLVAPLLLPTISKLLQHDSSAEVDDVHALHFGLEVGNVLHYELELHATTTGQKGQKITFMRTHDHTLVGPGKGRILPETASMLSALSAIQSYPVGSPPVPNIINPQSTTITPPHIHIIPRQHNLQTSTFKNCGRFLSS